MNTPKWGGGLVLVSARASGTLTVSRSLSASLGGDWTLVERELNDVITAAAEVLGVSDRVLVMGEGRLRGNFVNQGLTQEMVLAAAIGQGNQDG